MVYHFGVFTTHVGISDLKQTRKPFGLVMLQYEAELYCSARGYMETDFPNK